jgi:hypothetical protein
MTWKSTVLMVLCSAVVWAAGCKTSHINNATVNVPIACIPNDAHRAQTTARVGQVLGEGGIAAFIGQDLYTERYNISVPLPQRQEATRLLKQDARTQQYDLDFY